MAFGNFMMKTRENANANYQTTQAKQAARKWLESDTTIIKSQVKKLLPLALLLT